MNFSPFAAPVWQSSTVWRNHTSPLEIHRLVSHIKYSSTENFNIIS